MQVQVQAQAQASVSELEAVAVRGVVQRALLDDGCSQMHVDIANFASRRRGQCTDRVANVENAQHSPL